jgi:hypothetical protein
MLNTVRGLVRPVLSFVGFGVLSYLAVRGQMDLREYVTLVAVMVAFYFGTRDRNGT